jgi:hypothetical protein
MKKGKEEVGYLMLMDGNMDEELVPSGWENQVDARSWVARHPGHNSMNKFGEKGCTKIRRCTYEDGMSTKI